MTDDVAGEPESIEDQFDAFLEQSSLGSPNARAICAMGASLREENVTDTRDNHELFPTDNPEYTDGPGRIPRRADALLRMFMDDFQELFRAVMAHPSTIQGTDRVHAFERLANLFGQIALLGAIRNLMPADANRIAAGLADQWDVGDSLGEWVHQWRQELDAGKPLTVPMDPA